MIELTKEYLQRRYVVDLALVEDIASECGCSVANVRKWIYVWGVKRGHVLRTTGRYKPWNTGLTKATDARVAGVSDAMSGRVVSAETREKQAAAKRGKTREQANRWRGGTTKVGRYTEFRKTVDGRRIYVHRYVAEQSLGRQLLPLEHVHHVDRDESNNEPLNLLVLSESDHATLHGAIYRGECDSRAEQVEWLRAAGINFLEVQ